MPRYANLPARDALVLEYLGDGNVLDTNDGTKATLVATNVPYASCPVGYQKQWGVFNGSSSIVRTTTEEVPAAFSSTYSFVVAFKMDSELSSDGSRDIVMGQNSSSPYTSRLLRYNRSGGVNRLQAYMGTDNYRIATYNTNLGTGVHFAIVTHDGSTLRLYLDNPMNEVASNSDTPTQGVASSGVGGFNIGAYYGLGALGANFVPGNIVCRVFNRVLTETERLAYFHEFNRQLGGGSDFGAYIPQPTAYLEAVGEDTFYDIALGTKATRTAGSVATDDFGLSRAISGPNQSWTSVSGDSFVYWNNSGWKLEKNNAAVTATGINTANTVRCVLYFPTGTISTAQQTALENILKTKYAYAFRRSLLPALGITAYYDGTFSGSTAYDTVGGWGSKSIGGTMPASVRFQQNKSFAPTGSQYISLGTQNHYDANGWWYGQWISTTSTSQLRNEFNSSNGYFTMLRYNSIAGKATAYFYDGAEKVANSIKTINDGNPHFCVAEFLPGSYARIWVDGVIEATVSVGSATWLGFQEGQYIFSGRQADSEFLTGKADFMYGKGTLNPAKVRALMYATYRF